MSDLPSGAAVRVDVDDHAVALFHTADGLRAVDGICPHAGADLCEGEVDGGEVICPWHRWRYDLRTGRRKDREGQPLRVHETRVTDGWMWLEAPPP